MILGGTSIDEFFFFLCSFRNLLLGPRLYLSSAPPKKVAHQAIPTQKLCSRLSVCAVFTRDEGMCLGVHCLQRICVDIGEAKTCPVASHGYRAICKELLEGRTAPAPQVVR